MIRNTFVRQAATQTGGGIIAPAGVLGGGEGMVYTPPTESGGATSEINEAPPSPKNIRFFMSADLDTTRINRDVQRYVEEIIQHLSSVDGATVKVSLEVEAESIDGFTQQIVRTISENCQTLKVRDSGFEGAAVSHAPFI